jgi:hypothetical protein
MLLDLLSSGGFASLQDAKNGRKALTFRVDGPYPLSVSDHRLRGAALGRATAF